MLAAGMGLLAGTGVMVVGASVVLIDRVAQRRFTIGATLVTLLPIAAFSP
jgi:hypothetical protein